MTEFHKGGGSWLESSDRAEREAGRHLKACYHSIVGDPPTLSPGDHIGAADHLTRIQCAIDVGGWSKTEWNRLYRMRDTWKRRAEGNDARFNVVGNKHGGVSKPDRVLITQYEAIIEITERVQGTHGKDNTR